MVRKFLYLIIFICFFACTIEQDPVPATTNIIQERQSADTSKSIGNWKLIPGTSYGSFLDIEFKSKDTVYAIDGPLAGVTRIRGSFDGGKSWNEGISYDYKMGKLVKFKHTLITYGTRPDDIFSANPYSSSFFNCLDESTPGCDAYFTIYDTYKFAVYDAYATDQFFALLVPSGILLTNRPGYIRQEDAIDFDNNFEEIAFTDFNTLFGASRDGVISKTTDRKTWRDVLVDPTKTRISDIAFWDKNIGFASNIGGSGFKTSDGGETWTTVRIPAQVLGGNFESKFTMTSKSRWFCAMGSSVYETKDSGDTWTRSLKVSGFVEHLTFDQQGSIYVMSNDGLYRLIL